MPSSTVASVNLNVTASDDGPTRSTLLSAADLPLELRSLVLDESSSMSFFVSMFHGRGTVLRSIIPHLVATVVVSTTVLAFQTPTLGIDISVEPMLFAVFGE